MVARCIDRAPQDTFFRENSKFLECLFIFLGSIGSPRQRNPNVFGVFSAGAGGPSARERRGIRYGATTRRVFCRFLGKCSDLNDIFALEG